MVFPIILAVSKFTDGTRIEAGVPKLRQKYSIWSVAAVHGFFQHGGHGIQIMLDIALINGHLQNRYFHTTNSFIS